MLQVAERPGQATTPVTTTPVGSSRPPEVSIVARATDPRTGAVDTRQLANQIVDAARSDPAKANAAYAAIENQLGTGDRGRLAQDVRAAGVAIGAAKAHENPIPGPSITDAGHGAARAGDAAALRGSAMTTVGTRALTENPILTVQWENTRSAWNQGVGFSQPLRDALHDAGITINTPNLTAPAGSVGKGGGMTAGRANNINGPAAEQSIAARTRAQGYTVTTAPGAANRVQNGTRVVDVVGTRPAANADPRMAERIEIESKVGKTDFSGTTTQSGTPRYEVAKDAERLATNRAARTAGLDLEVRGSTLARGGEVLSKVGKVARPIGLVMDAVNLHSAYQADGGHIGENTGRAASGIAGGAAGGWGGAAAGAAIGTMIFPGVGTAVGGIVGGIAGAFGGAALGRGAFDTIKGWF